MNTGSFPILEFDSSREALIEPARVVKPQPVPQRCVLTFFQDVIKALVDSGAARPAASLHTEVGEHPMYRVPVDGDEVALFHPGLGGPMVAALFEELVAVGCRTFVACGGGGILDSQELGNRVLVVDSAVRDEGTSYHYLAPDREVRVEPAVTDALSRVLNTRNVPHVVGKAWTTDAIFRETRARVDRRRAEGCLIVEMEAASLLSVAAFRGVPLGVLLYGGDDVSGAVWDPRHGSDRASVREKLFWLSVEACQTL